MSSGTRDDAHLTEDRLPLLRLRSVSKKFGALRVLEEVNLEVFAGEVVALLGDNGAGKSTLIKIISGSLQPDQGELWFEGKPVVLQRPADAKALGIGHLVGTVEPGKDADLIVVDKDPLQEIKALRKMSMVMRVGKRIL